MFDSGYIYGFYEASLQALNGSACNLCTADLIYDQKVTTPTSMHNMFMM